VLPIPVRSTAGAVEREGISPKGLIDEPDHEWSGGFIISLCYPFPR
jgi:hypothetical protein